MLLLEVLDESDDEGALGQQHRCHPLEHCDGLIGEGNSEICLRHKGRAVEFFERVGDAFGLRARETPLFEFLDAAAGDQCTS